MPPAHQHQLVGCALETLCQPGQIVEQILRRQPDLLVGGPQHLGHLRHHRPEVDAVGFCLQLLQRQPVRVLAVPVSEGAGAQREIQNALGATVLVVFADLCAVESLGERHVIEESVVDRRDVDVLGGHAGAKSRQPDQDLPLMRPIRIVRLEHRRRVVGDAVDREVEDQIVVVRLFQRR